jgi:hypothetical protein
MQLASVEDTEAAAQQEYDESAAYAEELSERNPPFPCGVFGCSKRYAKRVRGCS